MPFVCAIKECKNAHKVMHVFPADAELFKLWTEACHREDILYHKRRNYRVCDAHFSEENKFVSVRNRTDLKVDAVPHLNLPQETMETHEIPVPGTSRDFDTQRSSMETMETHENVEEVLVEIPMPGTSRDFDMQRSSMEIETEKKGTDPNYEVATDDPDLTEAVDTQEGTPQHDDSISPSTPKKRRLEVHSPRTPKFRKDIRSRLNLLREGRVQRQEHLTPVARRYYRISRGLLRTARQLDTENRTNRQRLNEAMAMANEEYLLNDKVNITTLRFIKSQLRLQNIESRGRRFTMDDKVFGLILMKQSPKCYRLLEQVFALPSRRTLTRLLNKLPLQPGLNNQVLFALKQSVQAMTPLDRHCVLLFDEMAIEASLQYDIKHDQILGFEDTGESTKLKFANHAMVFMVRGVARKWKQPVCYFFSDAGMSKIDLVRNLRQIVVALQDVGLNCVATICDQLSTTSAIKYLMDDTNRDYLRRKEVYRGVGFEINKQEIVPLYDPPHLLKGVRNNMLKSSVQFRWREDRVQTASWQDIVRMYEADVGDFDMRMLNKLTDKHVYADHMKKMKVSLAAQIFSQRLSSTMRFVARHGDGCVPPSAADTADFLLFVDKLFDSVNGASAIASHGKLLRCAVTKDSPHVDFWHEAIKVLSNVKFVDERRTYVPPTINNWIVTLQGFLSIWKNLSTNSGFEFLCTRNFNQDPLENFFGCIRSHGVRNINPTCTAFIASYKSLVVNNFAAAHSPGANCEADDTEGALNTLRHFLDEESEDVVQDDADEAEEGSSQSPVFQEPTRDVEKLHSYIAGFVAKQLLKTIHDCRNCRADLISGNELAEHALIVSRAYSSKALLRPETYFRQVFSKSCQVAHHFLPALCVQKQLGRKLGKQICKYVNMLGLKCKEHELPNLFVKLFCKFYVKTWVNNVNRILRGLEHRNDHVNDRVKVLARDRFQKYKVRREAVNKLKGLQ